MRRAEKARAELEALWAAIFELYTARPAIGTLGAELVGLALKAEDLIGHDPTAAAAATRRTRELLGDLGEPAA